MQKLFSSRFNPNKTPTENVNAFRSIVLSITASEAKVEDSVLCSRLIGATPASWSSFKQYWCLQASSDRTLANLYTLIENEEIRLRSESKSQPKLTTPVAFISQFPFNNNQPRIPNHRQPQFIRGQHYQNYSHQPHRDHNNNNRQNNAMFYGGSMQQPFYLPRQFLNQPQFRPNFNQQFRPRVNNNYRNQNFRGQFNNSQNNQHNNQNRNQYPQNQNCDNQNNSRNNQNNNGGPPQQNQSRNNGPRAYVAQNSNQVTPEEPQLFATYTTDQTENTDQWILDSGASNHFYNSKDLFINYEPLVQPLVVKVGGSQNLLALGTGTVLLMTSQNTERCILELAHVLYVPTLRRNLVSLSSLLQFGWTVQAVDDQTTLKKDSQLIVAHVDYGLFILDASSIPNSLLGANMSILTKNPTPQEAHETFEHIKQKFVKSFNREVSASGRIKSPVNHAFKANLPERRTI